MNQIEPVEAPDEQTPYSTIQRGIIEMSTGHLGGENLIVFSAYDVMVCLGLSGNKHEIHRLPTENYKGEIFYL